MNLDRLLFDAKQKAIALRKTSLISTKIAALILSEAIKLNSSGYQSKLDKALLGLLSQSQQTDWYQKFFDYEKHVNLTLCQLPEPKARMQHFMDTGRPLVN